MSDATPRRRKTFAAERDAEHRPAAGGRIAGAPQAAPRRPLAAAASLHAAAGNRAVESLLLSLADARGRSLPDSIRREMEERFSADFRGVRVHTDAAAAQSAHALNARAFAVGGHLVFGRAEFDAQTVEGRFLIAHELAHVVQQSRGGAWPGTPGASAALESGAQAAASQILGGAGRVSVSGASGIGVARQPKGDTAAAEAARIKIAQAVTRLDALETAVRQRQGQVTLDDVTPAYDAVNSALQKAHASGDQALVAQADKLKDRYSAATRNTPVAPPTSSFDTKAPASPDPMDPDEAHRTVTAQRGFPAGLPAGKLAEAGAEITRLEGELKTAASEEKRTELRQKIAALRQRIAISTPTLKDPAALATQKTALEEQLKTAPTEAKRTRIQQQLKSIDEQLQAVTTATGPGKAAPLASLQGGRLGHSGATYIKIQIVGTDGKVLATVEAHNTPDLHAEQAALKQLENFPDKSKFEGATMIVSGDQEVCEKRCVPAVQKFAATYKLNEAVGDTVHAPALTSTGGLTGEPASAKTTIGKVSNPDEIGKLETAQRQAGQIKEDEPVKLEVRRVQIYKRGEIDTPDAVPHATVLAPSKTTNTGSPNLGPVDEPVLAAGGGLKTGTRLPQPGVGDETHIQPGAPLSRKGPVPLDPEGSALHPSAGMGAAVAGDIIAIFAVPILNHYLQKHYEKEFAEYAQKVLLDAVQRDKGQLQTLIVQRQAEIAEAQADGRLVSIATTFQMDWVRGTDSENSGLSAGTIATGARLVDMQLLFEGQTAKPYRPPQSHDFLGAVGDIAADMLRNDLGQSFTYESINFPLKGTDKDVRRYHEIVTQLEGLSADSPEYERLTAEKEQLRPHYEAFVQARDAREAQKAARKAESARQAKLAEDARKERKRQEMEARLAAKPDADADPGFLPSPGRVKAPPVQAGADPLGLFAGPRAWTPADTADVFEAQQARLVAWATRVKDKRSGNTLSEEELARFRTGRDEWIGQLQQTIAIFTAKDLDHAALDRLKHIADWLRNEGWNALLRE